MRRVNEPSFVSNCKIEPGPNPAFLLWGQDDRFEAKLLVVNSTPDERPKLSIDCEVRGKRMRFLMDTSLFGDGLTQLLTQPLNHQKVIARFR